MAQSRSINGVLPAPAALSTKNPSTASSATKGPSRTMAPRLRLIVRRLPPGLTQAEFEDVLGEGWSPGAGRVEWAAYKEGKVSKDPAKPSRPARAYLQVKDQASLELLSTVVRDASFQDARNTSKDSCLLGPPCLEFSPYGRIPSGRVRTDARQGTIDQDPEFIDFLQRLTEPVTRAAINSEAGEGAGKSGKAKTTPLVEFLKEKKANKIKEAAAAKASKAKAEPKNTKAEKVEPKKVSVIKKEAPSPSQKSKADKPALDNVKSASKSTPPAVKTKADTTQSASPSPQSVKPATAPVKRERERGSISAAAKILQRDLGLTPTRAERRISRGAIAATKDKGSDAKAAAVAPTIASQQKIPASSNSAIAEQTATPTTSSPPVPPTGPRNSKAPTPASQVTTKPAVGTPRAPRVKYPTPGAKSAFLKHANISQGVTEELLQAAFSTFGSMTRCEIDRKKGFGYVDFEDTESLKKAIRASPVKVGDKGGQVVVLENRTVKPNSQPAPPKTASTNNNSPAPPQATSPATNKPETSSVASPDDKSPPPPSAPRGSLTPSRGGGQAHTPRGNYGPSRGGSGRGGRGGRGAFRGRGGPQGPKTPTNAVATAVTPASPAST